MSAPEFGTEDYRRWAALFNDITFAPTEQFVWLDTRQGIADYLWDQGWRRDVRPEDVTTKAPEACREAPGRLCEPSGDQLRTQDDAEPRGDSA